MNESQMKEIVTAISSQLPKEMIEQPTQTALEAAFRNFAYDARGVEKLVVDAIVERAKELLKTKYADRVEKEAEILAARVATELPKMQLKESRGY